METFTFFNLRSSISLSRNATTFYAGTIEPPGHAELKDSIIVLIEKQKFQLQLSSVIEEQGNVTTQSSTLYHFTHFHFMQTNNEQHTVCK